MGLHLPKHIRTKSQAKKDRRALKILRSAGLIHKADLRRPPTPAAKRAIRKYKNVIEGRAKVVRPKNPRTYKNVFKVAGKNVIVPKGKGQRIGIDKAGKITIKRMLGKGKKKRTSSGRMTPAKKVRRPKAGERVAYAIPFNSGGRVTWFRFATYDALKKFLAEYESKYRRGYKHADDYILVEHLRSGERLHPDDDDEEERNADLDDRLERNLTYRREQRQAFSSGTNLTRSGAGSGYEG